MVRRTRISILSCESCGTEERVSSAPCVFCGAILCVDCKMEHECDGEPSAFGRRVSSKRKTRKSPRSVKRARSPSKR